MAKAKHLPVLRKSPIVEATFQVNFALKPLLTEADVKSFVAKAFPTFAYKEDFFTESIAVKKKAVKDPPEEITHRQNWAGSRFCKDNLIITVFPDGFALGILKPYPTDGSFFGEIEKIARGFSDRCFPSPVTRIGLRFINRFAVDSKDREPRKLFSTMPAPPSRQGCGEPVQFLYQDVFRDPSTGTVVVVNRLFPQVAGVTQEPGALLDIDASQTPNRVLDAKEFAATIDELRYAVDKTFFGSVKRPIIEGLK